MTQGKSKYLIRLKGLGFGSKMLKIIQCFGVIYCEKIIDMKLLVQNPVSFYTRLGFRELDKKDVEKNLMLVERIVLECPEWQGQKLHIMTINQQVQYEPQSIESIYRKVQRIVLDVKQIDRKFLKDNKRDYTMSWCMAHMAAPALEKATFVIICFS